MAYKKLLNGINENFQFIFTILVKKLITLENFHSNSPFLGGSNLTFSNFSLLRNFPFDLLFRIVLLDREPIGESET